MPNIIFNKVCFSHGSHLVINELSISIKIHRNSFIVGESGIGKSTFLKLILGECSPVSGSISIPKIKMIPIFQNFIDSLLPWKTIRENVKFGNDRHDQVDEVSYLLEITHILNSYPHQISGGEAQRVLIARALMFCPDLLICDEPMSQIDIETSSRILLKLKAYLLLNRINLIWITHRPFEADLLGGDILKIDNKSISKLVK